MKWTNLLARAPLPMLALAASYGVYQYALLYVPWWVALIQAAAFESVYLGLAVVGDFSDQQRRRAAAISGGAVVTSIIYNTLSALFHRVPLTSFDLPVYGELAFAALHGVPLAWCAYLVADLLLHSAHGARTEAAPVEEPAPMSAHVCVRCGAPVKSQPHAAASKRWGCESCKEKAA